MNTTNATQPSSLDILERAAQHQRDRAATYDSPQGERSMGRAVRAFNATTGRDETGTGLSETEGWLLLQTLKDVRLLSAPGYHADSAEDSVSYASLKAEAKASEASKNPNPAAEGPHLKEELRTQRDWFRIAIEEIANAPERQGSNRITTAAHLREMARRALDGLTNPEPRQAAEDPRPTIAIRAIKLTPSGMVPMSDDEIPAHIKALAERLSQGLPCGCPACQPN